MNPVFFTFLASNILCLLVLSNSQTTSQTDLNLLPNTKNDTQFCRVLALEGGGDHGAFQAGAIRGLIEASNIEDISWDVITGISAGTLNGGGFSLFEKGQEKEAIDFIHNIWHNFVKQENIYRNWNHLGKLGIAYGFFFKSSIYDTFPLKELLQSLMANRTLKRDFYFGVTNIKTGKYESYNGNSLNSTELINGLLSSSAIPMLFPEINFNNDYYADGGVKYGIDIISGVEACKSKGFSENQIIVDAVFCFKKQFNFNDPSKQNSLNVLMKLYDFWNNDKATRSYVDFQLAYKDVKLRYLVMPSKTFPSGKMPIVFDKDEIEDMIATGYEDGKKVVKDYDPNLKLQLIDEYVEKYKNPKKVKLNTLKEIKDEKGSALGENELLKNLFLQ